MVKSYAHGLSTTPLLAETVAECLDRIATEHPAAEAIVSRQQGIRLTYSELRAQAVTAAGALIASGIEPGDRVGVCSAGCVEWLIMQHAAARVGAVVVGINPAYRANELEYVLAHAGIALLLVGRRFAGNDPMARLLEVLRRGTPPSGPVECPALPSLRTIVGLGATGDPQGLSWTDFTARATGPTEERVRARRAAVSIDDPALILYTSGTTGRPKGVILSHHNVINGGFFVGERLRYTCGDRLCVPLPLYHVLGCVAAGVAALTHGAAIVLPGASFDARLCLEAIDQERCTAIYGVPTMFLAQLEYPDRHRYQVTSLRTGVVSGASCSPDLMRRIIDEMHLPEITVGYGMTEVAPVLYTAIDDSLANRVSTAGTVQPHIECKIVDPASGHIVPRGMAGELCARGYCVMRGYWKDTAATDAVIDESGWIHSGDLAVMRHDGYVSIVGRVKDVVIRGGENVSPLEIEDRLRRHPKVRDAYIVGVPDREYGEEICAWVRLRDAAAVSPEALRQYCRAHLASHKIPRYVCFASEFPMTPSGKIQKFRLRELAQAQLGLIAAEAEAVSGHAG
jgi:fatty-acyl-CoA synthase